MNFDFSEDQQFLKTEARKFLDAECPPDRVRKSLETNAGAYDPDLWQQVIDMGWVAAGLPEAVGGLGLGRVDVCAIAEELGRACAPIPFNSTVFGFSEAVQCGGSTVQCQDWLPQVAAGKLIGCLALSEQPGALNLDAIETTYQNGKLSGTKAPVTDGAIAGAAIVLARHKGEIGLFIVSLEDVEAQPLESIDQSRGVARLVFDETPAEPLCTGRTGKDLLCRVLQGVAVFTAFEQLGGAERCLDMARDFALQRFAFGRPIAGFQAIKHKLADMYVKNTLARAHAYYGAWALAGDKAELPLAAAAARVSACDAYWFASKENIQTHGGMGFTWEADCHLYFRRARHLALVGGAAREWKELLATAIEADLAA
ncbi:acyl-CoA dehydrogenase family protein [Hyphomonas sp.]|jgi:alkylation response protein AidB-like acyl-CoA dehydrogenase|uniref:acyl-CoA dehydrogenase family protein n=3 Tax=Hyphomonas sp. TaxID=87 RepID=UPI003001F41F